MYLFDKEKKRILFIQEINKENLTIKIYQDFKLWFTHIENSSNNI